MKPSVGRIVHYVAMGSVDGKYPVVCRAAIVTDVSHYTEDGFKQIGVCVLNPQGLFFNPDIPYDDGSKGLQGGTWHWPERID